jgi:hypothetical protein
MTLGTTLTIPYGSANKTLRFVQSGAVPDSATLLKKPEIWRRVPCPAWHLLGIRLAHAWQVVCIWKTQWVPGGFPNGFRWVSGGNRPASTGSPRPGCWKSAGHALQGWALWGARRLHRDSGRRLRGRGWMWTSLVHKRGPYRPHPADGLVHGSVSSGTYTRTARRVPTREGGLRHAWSHEVTREAAGPRSVACLSRACPMG